MLLYKPCYLVTYEYYSYNNLMFLKSDSNKYSNEYSNELNSSDLHSTESEENHNSGPEQDSEGDEDFVQKTVNNNNLITVKLKHKFSQLHKLDLVNLKITPVSLIYNLLEDRETILK